MWNAISPGFELVSPCPIPATITITPRAPPYHCGSWWYEYSFWEGVKNSYKYFIVIFSIPKIWMLKKKTFSHKLNRKLLYSLSGMILNLRLKYESRYDESFLCNINGMWRAWCNGYRRKTWNWWPKFKSKTRLFRVNALWERHESIYSFASFGYIVRQTGFC